VALGSTKPLKKICPGKFSWGKDGQCIFLTTLPTSVSRISENVRASTSDSPKSLHGLYRDRFTFTLPKYGTLRVPYSPRDGADDVE
jgi:hypothetical protein